MTTDLIRRAAGHAALGDPLRLAIVDELAASDRAPVELRRMLGIESNLLAHHLGVLETVGLVRRTRSSGDARWRYVRLVHAVALDVGVRPRRRVEPALFVCSRNSARSQLAAALWRAATHTPATSAGTHPDARVHPGAVAAAGRAGLDLTDAAPIALGRLNERPALVVTVCDQAHEVLAAPDAWLHWSIPDPVTLGTDAAFDETVDELRQRIATLTGARSHR